MKMTVLVGLPGSGKSTYCLNNSSFIRINQDELGTRDKCAEKILNIIKEPSNKDVVICIDRTNIDKRQRSNWIKLAKHHNFESIDCVEFKAHPDACVKRILKRSFHETIPNTTPIQKIAQIVRQFFKSYEEVSLSEGFSSHTIINVDNPASQADQGDGN